MSRQENISVLAQESLRRNNFSEHHLNSSIQRKPAKNILRKRVKTIQPRAPIHCTITEHQSDLSNVNRNLYSDPNDDPTNDLEIFVCNDEQCTKVDQENINLNEKEQETNNISQFTSMPIFKKLFSESSYISSETDYMNPIPPRLLKIIHHDPESNVYKALRGQIVNVNNQPELISLLSSMKSYETQCLQNQMMPEARYVRAKIKQLSTMTFVFPNSPNNANDSAEAEFLSKKQQLQQQFDAEIERMNSMQYSQTLESVEQQNELFKKYNNHLKVLAAEYNQPAETLHFNPPQFNSQIQLTPPLNKARVVLRVNTKVRPPPLYAQRNKVNLSLKSVI